MLHPFMPFITEEIYHLLKKQTDDLCVKQFGNTDSISAMVTQLGNILKESITAVRDTRNKNQIKSKEEN